MNLKIKKLITLLVLFFAQNYVQAAAQQRPQSKTELEVAIAEVKTKQNPLDSITGTPTQAQIDASATFDTKKKDCVSLGESALASTDAFERLEREYQTKYPLASIRAQTTSR